MNESGVFSTHPFYSISIKHFSLCYSTRLKRNGISYRDIFIMREIKVVIPFFSLKIFFFLMWTIFKVFIEFVTILLLFYVLVFWPRGTWDLSSSTRDRTHTPCIGRWSLNHQTAREVPWGSCISFSANTIANVLCYPFFFFFPIGLLVFFFLICKNFLHIKALTLGLSYMLQIFLYVCYLPFVVGYYELMNSQVCGCYCVEWIKIYLRVLLN